MKYRNLGNTGIVVSEIGMGCNTIAGVGTYGPADEAEGLAAVRRAVDLGVTFFDTAEGYAEGHSEEALGQVLGNRSDVVICSKVGGRAGGLTPERIRPAAEASLRRLQRDAIEVYLLHNPTTEQVRDPAYRDAMEALRRDGLIRSYGVSATTNIMLPQSEEILDQGSYTSIELEINLVYPEAGESVLPRAKALGVGLIIRVPLASGLLTGKYNRDTVFPENDFRAAPMLRDRRLVAFDALDALTALAAAAGVEMSKAALAWILTYDAVSSVIPGCRNVAQVEANVAAGDVTLSARFLEGVRALHKAQTKAGS